MTTQTDNLPDAHASPPREDVLISACFADVSPTAAHFEMLRRLAGQISQKYRYWEIVLVMDDVEADAYQPLLQSTQNIRIVKLRAGVQPYQRRVIAALEAIGDIVLLSSVHEYHAINLIEMIEKARTQDSVVIGMREQSNILNPAVTALGNLSGFRATARNMASAAYPRTLLNRLLAYPDRQLVLRFIPRDPALPVIYMPATAGQAPRGLSGVGQRLSLIQRLLINAAPRVLSFVSILSAITAISAFLFAIYAVIVWLTFDTIQPGWLTTSLAISTTTCFLGVSIFGLASGLQKLIELVSPNQMLDVVGEESSGDLFSQIIHELNVEVALDGSDQLEKSAISASGTTQKPPVDAD